MYTIEDYVKYYKNCSLKKLAWNTADNLVCQILTYLSIKEFYGSKKLKDLIVNDKARDKRGLEGIAKELLREIMDSIRYRDMIISNFVNICNDTEQFGAVTFRIHGNTIVAYKGTDNSLVGWIENARLLYMFPTITQDTAVRYLKRNIKIFKDRKIYIIGHSKGGNLAISSSYLANKYITRHIVNIVNFDGPGLRYDEYKTQRFDMIKGKLINIIPTGSIVGVLLENDNYTVVKSKNVGWHQHNPCNWLMFGEYFINYELSKNSLELHNRSSVDIRDINKEELKFTLEEIYKRMKLDKSCEFKLNLQELWMLYSNIKDCNPIVKKKLKAILSTLIKSY